MLHEVAFTFALSASQIKSWSADGQVEFRITSNNDVISFSDFINPCGPLSPINTYGTSKVRFQLSYNAVEIAYSIEDNTNQIVNTGVLTSPNQPKLVQLPIGAYTVTYTVEDVHGNATSCTWPIVVQDKVQPHNCCKPGFFAKANPSGLVALSLDEGDLLGRLWVPTIAVLPVTRYFPMHLLAMMPVIISMCASSHLI